MELIVNGELHFRAHDGDCIRCGQKHTNDSSIPATRQALADALDEKQKQCQELEAKLTQLKTLANRDLHDAMEWKREVEQERDKALAHIQVLNRAANQELGYLMAMEAVVRAARDVAGKFIQAGLLYSEDTLIKRLASALKHSTLQALR